MSADALTVARANAARLGLDDRADAESDLLERVTGDAFELIVSNPPYIAEPEMATLQPEVAEHEPRLATVAGADGLEIYRRLLPQAQSGWPAAATWCWSAAPDRRRRWQRNWKRVGYADVGMDRDLSGIERIVWATWALAVAADAESRMLAGELALLPTDTVYGVAAAAELPRGVRAAVPAQAAAARPADGDHAGLGRGSSQRSLPELTGRSARDLPAAASWGGDADRAQPAGRFRHLCGGSPQAIGVCAFRASTRRSASLADGLGGLMITSANTRGGADPARA